MLASEHCPPLEVRDVKKLSLLVLLTLLAACKDPQPEGEALRARVLLAPSVSA